MTDETKNNSKDPTQADQKAAEKKGAHPNDPGSAEPEVQSEGEPDLELSTAQILELKKQLEEKTKEIKELNNRIMYARADYENLRKRMEKRVLEASQVGVESFIKKLLPVMDTFESANRQVAESNADKKVVDGFEMLFFQFSDILEKEGLKAIPAKGTRFNVEFHEAVARCSREDLEDEIVTNEFEKGYTFQGRVLRPAKVEVNQR